MSELLDAALAAAARGWPVFPCRPGRKDPATEHGFKDATTDPAQIRDWWAKQPACNVAIPTGETTADVLDIDIEPGGNGLGALAILNTAGLLAGHGPVIRTRSGGFHYYFTGTRQRSSDARDHSPVDFKAAGGYVLIPPSFVEADGKGPAGRYETISDTQPAAALDWRIVRDLLIPPPLFQQPPTERAALGGTYERAGDDYAARTTWEQILHPHGWRQVRQIENVRYWCRPGKTGNFVSASTRDDGGLWVFSTSTVFEANRLYSKFGACTVLEHGGDYQAAAQALRDAGYGTPLTAAPGPAAVTYPSSGELETIAAGYAPVDWRAAWNGQPDEVEWLIDGFLEAGTVNSLFAKAGVGKSLLALDISRGLAQQGITVVYIDDENRIADLVERLQDMGCKPAELDRLLVYSFAGLPALDTPRGGVHLAAVAITRGARLVVLDTTSRMIAGKENDADTFLQLYRCSLLGLKKNGITVLRLDHPGKDMTKGQRGSSAKEGDVDTIWRLEPVTGTTYRLEREKSRSGHGEPFFTLQRQPRPLRHEWETGADDELIRQLDELGLPRDAGRDQARALLSKAGITAGTDKLAAALRARRLLFRPGLTDSGQVAVSRSGPKGAVRDFTEPIHENPRSDLTWTGNGQAGQVNAGAGLPDLTQPHPVGVAGAVRSGAPDPDTPDAPLCDRCGKHHHRYGSQGRPCMVPAVTP